jgi:hypothetical protein
MKNQIFYVISQRRTEEKKIYNDDAKTWENVFLIETKKEAIIYKASLFFRFFYYLTQKNG